MQIFIGCNTNLISENFIAKPRKCVAEGLPYLILDQIFDSIASEIYGKHSTIYFGRHLMCPVVVVTKGGEETARQGIDFALGRVAGYGALIREGVSRKSVRTQQ